MHTILSQAPSLRPMGGLPLIESWAGLRPRAEDDLPASPLERLKDSFMPPDITAMAFCWR
jgi:hypothetical protein